MNVLKLPWFCWMLVAWGAVSSASGQSQLLINEILLNPPGTDTPNEYIEIRGMPSYVIPAGSYFVGVEGDTNGNPGSIQNIFDLSGQRLGANGFLVLLQKTNSYTVNASATLLVNTASGSGWGSGPTSSIGHRGEGGQTELENASATYFLIRTAVPPSPSQDIDQDNNGVPDGVFTNWTVLDSVGVLDASGFGDIAYGAINFRWNIAPGNGATASGTIVAVPFTAGYIGRSTNSFGSDASDWVASNNLGGTAPNWVLDDANNTVPARFAGRALSNIGGPNFDAVAIKGLVIAESGGSTDLSEGGPTDSYTVGLNIPPAGNVVVRVSAPAPLRISTDGGATFGLSRSLTFNSTAPQTVIVRALADNTVDTSPYQRTITHTIISTADPGRYPTTLPLAPVVPNITDADSVLLSELKVNPPGANDGPYEYVELRGASDLLLTNVYLLVLEGNAGLNPGKVNLAVNLSSQRFGENGLMLIAAPNHPYAVAPETAVVTEPALSALGGALGNSTISFVLVSSPLPISTGVDLDGGDNGILEGLPQGTRILDAVGWRDGNASDIVYGGVMLSDTAAVPDAAARFLNDNAPLSASAWFFGELAGTDGASLVFDKDNVSANFPDGTVLTPGGDNSTAPTISPLGPISGAIADPTNPKVSFTVADQETAPELLTVLLTSSNPSVIPDDHLLLAGAPGGLRTLTLDPIGVGYSTITVTVSDGEMTNSKSFRYAASERCDINTRFHVESSDASAAIPIDSQLMFAGDDENQVLRIYNRHQSGDPIAKFDMTPFLGLTDFYDSGRPREVDIEAATLVGRRIFWIGGHSHSSEAEGRTNRSRIFGTDWAGSGASSTLSYVGRYDYLKLDLVTWDANNLHGKGSNYFGLAASTSEGVDPKAPDGSGFNIEGLTMAPGSDVIGYIGFRAPIVPATNRSYALVVPVLNFSAVAVSNGRSGSAIFGQPIELDLFGRGIRSIDRIGTNYLIIAGPPGNFPGAYPNDFRLYTWTGNSADRPQERAADLTGLTPEAVVELPPGPWAADTQFQLVSDCGRKIWYNDDVPAKLLTEPKFKKFRTDIVGLGAVNKPIPVMISVKRGPSGVTVWWRATAGERYRLQFKNSLNDLNWTDLPGDVTASGAIASKLDPAPVGTHRFYHVALLP